MVPPADLISRGTHCDYYGFYLKTPFVILFLGAYRNNSLFTLLEKILKIEIISLIEQIIKHIFLPSFRLVVVIRTSFTFITSVRWARLSVIGFRMIIELIPAMTVCTFSAIWATDFIICDEWIRIPLRTFLSCVLYLRRSASEVLPIMWVNTHASIMIYIVERTWDGLVKEDIEISVIRVIV